LSVNRGRILDEALSADLIPSPRRVVSPENDVGTARTMGMPLKSVRR